MNRRVLGVAIFGAAIGMIAMLSAGVMAETAVPKPKTIKGSAVIIGTGGIIADGACITANTYAEICPSGTCECFTITDAKVSGRLYGKGTADVFATIDLGNGLSGTPPTCLPVYGAVILNTSGKKAATETVNFQGAFCAPASVNGKGSVGAAWQIVESTNNESGLGTVTGQGVHEGGGIDITLTGTATITPGL
jgi:hypothetical protein